MMRDASLRAPIDSNYNKLIINAMIETTQKLIQIGSSDGVTLSKKDLARLGAKRGDLLKVRVELLDEPAKHTELLKEYDYFVKKYGETLKNLSDR
jgi:hypothetical protein